MATNTTIKRGVTHEGKAMFCHMKKTEEIQGKDTGKYTLMLALDEAGQKALYGEVCEVWNAFLQTPEMQGKNVQQHWNNGFRKYKETVYAKFSTSASIKTRRGETIEVTIPVFDGAGNQLPLKQEIGNGSTVKVAYDLYPYYMSQNVHGVSLRLKAVQVLDLKTYGGGSASSFGFSTDGPALNVAEQGNNDENPFPEEYAAAPVDDDFPIFDDNGGDF